MPLLQQSGAQKRKQKKLKDENTQKKKRTLFEVGCKVERQQTKDLKGVGVHGDDEVSLVYQHETSYRYDVAAKCLEDVLCKVSQGRPEEEQPTSYQPSSTVSKVESQPLQGPAAKFNERLHDLLKPLPGSAAKENREVDLSAEGLTGCPDETEQKPGAIKIEFDIGKITTDRPTNKQIEEAVLCGPAKHPEFFPRDGAGRKFPKTVLYFTASNNERHARDWLTWSRHRQALFCFPCRLLYFDMSSSEQTTVTPAISSKNGYSASEKSGKWNKTYHMLRNHERSAGHKRCYVQWKSLEQRLKTHTEVDVLLQKQIHSETAKWRHILKRILSVVLFLGERNLAFRGSNQHVGDNQNGNFLGILQLLGTCDPILKSHLDEVEKSQNEHHRLQVHYLSDVSQNDLITTCAGEVRKCILEEIAGAKYFSLIADATPDCSHHEQTTIILRYVKLSGGLYSIEERFLVFIDCDKKTGSEIAAMLLQTLETFHIPLCNLRGQGYDNGANMSGKYKGAQAEIKKAQKYAIFSPCGAHTLNLCGVDAAECCVEAVTFFGVVQKLYNLFSSSPQRWAILQAKIACSLHSVSKTRWSARIDSVKQVAHHLPGILEALEGLFVLNLTAEAKAEINSLSTYLKSFEALLMSSLWLKILIPIEQVSKVVQARNSTIDVEADNLKLLVKQLKKLQCCWDNILQEATHVATAIGTEPKFRLRRMHKQKKHFDEREESEDQCSKETISGESSFRKNVFDKILLKICRSLEERFDNLTTIVKMYDFLWTFLDIDGLALTEKCKNFSESYIDDVDGNLLHEEMIHLRQIYTANISTEIIPPAGLLNKLQSTKLSSLFPNVIISLRMFLTLPVSVAEAERSFSKLKLIKNYLRSSMGQSRLSDLAMLSIERDISRNINFDKVIDMFAHKCARKALITV